MLYGDAGGCGYGTDMGKEEHVRLENPPGHEATSFDIRGTTNVIYVPKFSNTTPFACVFLKRRSLLMVTQGFVSGLAYYVIGWVSKERGPVFVSAFNPLSMVIVAVLSTFVFMEKMYLGR